MVIRMEHHNGFLPSTGSTRLVAVTASLALAIRRAHGDDFHIVDLLDGLLNLGLTGIRVDLEGVRAPTGAPMPRQSTGTVLLIAQAGAGRSLTTTK